MPRDRELGLEHPPLAALIALARDSVRRIEHACAPAVSASPTTHLCTANALATQGALLTAIARELEARAYEDLGRFAVEAVDRGATAEDPRAAAELVAESFLSLHRAG